MNRKKKMTRTGKTAGTRPGRTPSLLGAILSMALGLAMFPQAARSDEDARHGASEARDEHGDKDKANERRREEEREQARRHAQEERSRHEIRRPLYAPPSVYYVEPQSPGISFVLPLDIHVR